MDAHRRAFPFCCLSGGQAYSLVVVRSHRMKIARPCHGTWACCASCCDGTRERGTFSDLNLRKCTMPWCSRAPSPSPLAPVPLGPQAQRACFYRVQGSWSVIPPNAKVLTTPPLHGTVVLEVREEGSHQKRGTEGGADLLLRTRAGSLGLYEAGAPARWRVVVGTKRPHSNFNSASHLPVRKRHSP